MKVSHMQITVMALVGITVLSGCNLLNQTKSDESSSSVTAGNSSISSSSSIGISSSSGLSSSTISSSSGAPLPAPEKAALDTLLNELKQSGDTADLKLVQSLAPDCQLKYLQMNADSAPTTAGSSFFGDNQCFNSVVAGMTPPNLSPECKTLYQAPFNYYQANWSVLDACQEAKESQATPTEACKKTMAPLMEQSKLFHDKCGLDPKFPWEGGMDNNPQPQPQPQPGDSTQPFQDMKTFCAVTANASKPECVQFVKCDPLYTKMKILSDELETKQSQCPVPADSTQMNSMDNKCFMDLQIQYASKFQYLQQELQKQGCMQNQPQPMPGDSTMPQMKRRR